MKNNIVIFDDFFSADECVEFLARHTGDFKHMDVLGNEKEHRVAQGKWIFDENDIFVERFKLLVCALTGIPITHQEAPHLVKYDVGGKYDAHHDFFHPNTDYYEGHTKVGGQRVVSSLLYLNEDFLGGETEFPKREKIVTPKTGRILSWRNVKLNDELDYDSLHAGKPVISGTKYILIIWTRERDLKNTAGRIVDKQTETVKQFNHTPIKQTDELSQDFSKLDGQFYINKQTNIQPAIIDSTFTKFAVAESTLNESTISDKSAIFEPTLRELTKEHHDAAESTMFMRLFAAKAITEVEYAKYLTQMVLIYTALETKLEQIPEFADIFKGGWRLSNMRRDLAKFTENVGAQSLCLSTVDYYNEILQMKDANELFAHYYVRIAGDLFGGQMLKKLVPGAASWYDFDDDVNNSLKVSLRKLALFDLAPDVKIAYERNVDILNELL